MTEIVKAERRHFSDIGWLQSYWLFSFSDYHDPQNERFGSLRVFNDDIVAPGTGFPMHPHRDMEIVTLVLRGEMTHQDSLGNRAVIRAGDVQRMSAGAGLTHSEHNLGTEPVHIYQIWIFPERKGLTPSYDQRTFDPDDRRNRLHPVASGRGDAGAVTLHADAVIHRCDLDAGRVVTHEAAAGRRTFVYVESGRLLVDGRELDANDQARLDAAGTLVVEARERADFVLIDVPS
ncbi:MAG: pirin family protein [bacterium]|nr:pirin family protein [bacterium]